MISGIASVLVISVFQKSRELGILKAMGIKDKDASLIFIYQGFLLGLIGSLIGILLGLGLLLSFNSFNVNADGEPLVDLYIDYNFIFLSWLTVVICATLAAIIPARKSLQLNPIDVIREG
jgi:lipoprotein-releasing system permease protein